jgi:hypothetical protein
VTAVPGGSSRKIRALVWLYLFKYISAHAQHYFLFFSKAYLTRAFIPEARPITAKAKERKSTLRRASLKDLAMTGGKKCKG